MSASASIREEVCSDGIPRWILIIGLPEAPRMSSGYFPDADSALAEAGFWTGGTVEVVPLPAEGEAGRT